MCTRCTSRSRLQNIHKHQSVAAPSCCLAFSDCTAQLCLIMGSWITCAHDNLGVMWVNPHEVSPLKKDAFDVTYIQTCHTSLSRRSRAVMSA